MTHGKGEGCWKGEEGVTGKEKKVLGERFRREEKEKVTEREGRGLRYFF